MNVRRQLAALLSSAFVLLCAAPTLLPQAQAAPGGDPIAAGPARKGSNASTSWSVVNLTDERASFAIELFRRSGKLDATISGTIDPNGAAWKGIDESGLANGWSGAAVLTADRPIAATVNVTRNADGTGAGSSWTAALDTGFGANIIPLLSRNISLTIHNTGADTMADLFAFGADGQGTGTFSTTPIGLNETVTETLSNIPGGLDVTLPATGQVFFKSGNLPAVWVTLGNTLADLPTLLPAYTEFNGEGLCLPGTGLGTHYTGFVQPIGNISGTISFYNQVGAVISGTQFATPNFGLTPIPGPPGTYSACVFTEPDAQLVGVVGEGYGGGNRAGRATRFLSAARGFSGGDIITKSAIAFGAVSSKQSAVSLYVMNVGTKKAKVRVTLKDGSGKKTQAKTLKNIPPRGVGVLDYGKKSRGNDIFADIKVKGSGSILAWLVRAQDGDAQIIPALRIR